MPGAGELRILRRRIKSVKSTQKITRAMELIAASRIAKARRQVEMARPYAEAITQVMRDLSGSSDVRESPLMRPAEEGGEAAGRTALIIITSDRGLAGAYNNNAIRRGERAMATQRAEGREIELYLIGGKAESHFRYAEEPFEQVWTGISDQPTYDDAREIANTVSDRYGAGKVGRVQVVYTDFRSALTQVATLVKILPVDLEAFAEEAEQVGTGDVSFAFEPDPVSLLERLIPRYVEAQMYAALLESAASEHASRQRAMKAATDNADEIVDNLTREANRARQAAITTEITEIVGGAEALSSR